MAGFMPFVYMVLCGFAFDLIYIFFEEVYMTKNETLKILHRLKPLLVERFGITRLALFGSTVRDEAGPDSDVDIVVSFDGPATSKRYFGVQFLLEDELGHSIDLVTEKAMRAELRPYIEQEAVNV
jgi:hypothetical protein